MVTNPRIGKPQRPSIFAYQVRKFTLVGGRINCDVESHDLRGIRQGGKGVTYTVNARDNQVQVNYASFPMRAGPDGNTRVTSGEIHDYFDNGSQITEEPSRHQMTWVGKNLEGRIANLRGWRYAALDNLPNTWLKEVIVDKAPPWASGLTTTISKFRPYRQGQIVGLVCCQ